MNKANLRIIGSAALVVVLMALVIFFDDIKAVLNEAMAEQADSLLNQLLR